MGSEELTNEYLEVKNGITCFGIHGVARQLEKMPDDISRLFPQSSNKIYKNRSYLQLVLIDPFITLGFFQDLEPFSPQTSERNLYIPEVNEFFYSQILMFKDSANSQNSQIDCYSIIGELKKITDFLENKITPEFERTILYNYVMTEKFMQDIQAPWGKWVKLGKN